MADPETFTSQPVPVESRNLVTSHKQVVEALLKFHRIHEGIWGLFIRFGLAAGNVGPNNEQVNPAAIIPIIEIGLQRFKEETNVSVDAAKVNPRIEKAAQRSPSHK